LQGVGLILLLVGFIAAILALVGIPVYLIATDSKYLPIATVAMQGIIAVIFASKFVLKVLRNRTPSPVILADWIGDSAVVMAFVVGLLGGIGRYAGWMHGAFEYAMGSILGLFAVGLVVYWVWGQRRVALALTARAVAGRWPWSAGC
jgi:hypothetical protein